MTAAPRVVLIADDLTGAMDVAGPLAARRLNTLVAATTRGCTAEHLSGAEVVSINANSRHLESTPAAQRIQGLVRRLVHPDAGVLIKKIDSTLRGNVVAETLAMLEASGRSAAIVAPAFPAQGRTLRDGIVHVEEVPLAQTNFARDALSPPPLEPLHVLFERATPQMQVTLVRAGDRTPDFDPSRRAIVIADTRTQDDLRSLIDSLRGRLPEMLLVGSAGIAQALGDVCFPAAASASAQLPQARRLMFVVGSRAERSTQQVGALLEAGDARRFAAPNGQLDLHAVAAAEQPIVIIQASSGPHGRAVDATEVAAALADGVARLLDTRPPDALIATGGDTAIAILERLSQPVVRVSGELLPGIPYGRIRTPRGDLWFITKAGGFGRPDTFATIARRLRKPEHSA